MRFGVIPWAMKRKKSHIKSKTAGIETLRRFFPDNSADEVSIDEALQAAGRPMEMEKAEDNRAWLSNKLTTLKYHNLLTVHYTYDDGRRKLDRLRLTLNGKRALGRVEDGGYGEIEPKMNNVVTPPDIMKEIAQLKKNYPEYEITFDMKLKVENDMNLKKEE